MSILDKIIKIMLVLCVGITAKVYAANQQLNKSVMGQNDDTMYCPDQHFNSNKALMSIIKSESFANLLTYEPKTQAQKLVGSINNQFGISNCLLAVIVKNIPSVNINATVAAIKRAQLDQQMVFTKNEDTLTQLANHSLAANMCVRYYLQNDKVFKRFIEDYTSLLQTPELRHAWDQVQLRLSGNAVAVDFGNSSIPGDDYKQLCAYFIRH